MKEIEKARSSALENSSDLFSKEKTSERTALQAAQIGRLNVVYLAPTGKAAMELMKKGLNAITVHSFLYTPDIVKPRRGEKRPPNQPRLSFSLNMPRIKSMKLDLIIVDEASMINYELYVDLMKTGVRIIFVGDHGQLTVADVKTL